MGWGEPTTPRPTYTEVPKDDLDPTVLLAEALDALRATDDGVLAGLLTDASMQYARVLALATIANGAALLMPTPEEVLATYQESTAEVLGEIGQNATRAAQILRDAIQRGPRHPGLSAALAALEGQPRDPGRDGLGG